ncbi:hypothetical protein STRTUCAR8_00919 [Streptomyces turgidiscabies Car8]|uniref:Uncharacterized protein n=1 Tax=Streptomyces turgidiscabies (strain Car8) TaxID=698760 RepID=L7EXK5_STRT8|nr:hypothetical protein STRTUCAR8_00919 [Streptomyces turgidiscabies Car8]
MPHGSDKTPTEVLPHRLILWFDRVITATSAATVLAQGLPPGPR